MDLVAADIRAKRQEGLGDEKFVVPPGYSSREEYEAASLEALKESSRPVEFPEKMYLAVHKKKGTKNSWWYELFSAELFEKKAEDGGYEGSLENAERYYYDSRHAEEVHVFELAKRKERVEDEVHGCDCEVTVPYADYAVKGMENASLSVEGCFEGGERGSFRIYGEISVLKDGGIVYPYPQYDEDDEFDIAKI
jgi:hypothetical protein